MQPPKLCANALRRADTSVADQTKSLLENRRRTELAILLLVLIDVPKYRPLLRRVWSRRTWPPIRYNPGAPVSGVGGMVPHGKMRLSLAIRLDLSHCYARRNAAATSRVSLLIVDVLTKWVLMHNTRAVVTGGIHVNCVVPPATQPTGLGSAAPPTRNAHQHLHVEENSVLLATFSYPKKLQTHLDSDAISLWGETQWQLHMRKLCVPVSHDEQASGESS